MHSLQQALAKLAPDSQKAIERISIVCCVCWRGEGTESQRQSSPNPIPCPLFQSFNVPLSNLLSANCFVSLFARFLLNINNNNLPSSSSSSSSFPFISIELHFLKLKQIQFPKFKEKTTNLKLYPDLLHQRIGMGCVCGGRRSQTLLHY